VLICLFICCVYGDTVQTVVVLLCPADVIVLFIVMNHECMVMNHFKMQYLLRLRERA